jgi:hypothetical protein
MGIFKELVKVCIHPIEGWQELFYRKKQSLMLANILAVAYFVVAILKRQLTGFIFNSGVQLDRINVGFLFTQTIVLLVTFAAINWAVSTLFDGEGKIEGIWICVCYSFAPTIFSTLLYVAASNMMAAEEQFFLKGILYAGYIWTGFLIIKSLENLHQYTIPQTLFTLMLTIFGILVVVFLFVLLLSLSQQVIRFFVTIFKELSLR